MTFKKHKKETIKKKSKTRRNSMTNATMTVEQIERKKAEVRVPQNEKHYGVIRITTTAPPHRPELRLSFTPFEKVDKKDKKFEKNNYTSSYILTTNESTQLLCAVFREAAKLLEESAQNLPTRSTVIASLSKE